MEAFWQFARRMLRYRATIVWAMVFAALSAGGLGLGLVSISPVLENILTPASRGLPDVAADYNSKVAGVAGWAQIPQPWIDRLPQGRFTAVVTLVSILGALTLLGGLANFLHA